MSPTINDLFGKASAPLNIPANAKCDARSSGSTNLILSDISTWPTDTPVFFTTYTPDADGNPLAGTRQDWKGIVNIATSSVDQLELTSGTTDMGNTGDDVAVMNPTAAWVNSLIDALRNTLNANGELKDGIVDKAQIASGAAQDITDVDGNVWVIRYGTDTTPVEGKYVLLIKPMET